MSNIIVYGLLDPDTRKIHYVGASTNPVNRYYCHGRRTINKSIGVWLDDLYDRDKYPIMVELCRGTKEYAGQLERRAVIRLRHAGHPITNVLKGGERWKRQERSEFSSKFRLAYQEFITHLLLDDFPQIMPTATTRRDLWHRKK